MKKHVLLVGLLFSIIVHYSIAQNKTFGVGATAPNPNAALHVESPTNNQGFIMPRLTTAQRNAMTAVLTASDVGLMLYDTTDKTLYVWNGTSWESSADTKIDASTNGSDTVARFKINNSASFAHALYAQTNGDSTAAAVHGNNIGHGFGVYGKSAGAKFASAAVYGLHVGTGDAAGAFRISNSANTFSALYGETNGSGAAIFASQLGLGRAGQFQIQNASNAQAAIRGFTNGTGRSGFFTINNPSSTSTGLYTENNGGGHSFEAIQTGTGNAIFANSNAGTGVMAISNGAGTSAIEAYKVAGGGSSIQAGHNGANANGNGNAIFGFADGGASNAIKGDVVIGNGHAGLFSISSGGLGNAINATTNGTGSAGKFVVNNVNSPAPALWAETNSNQPLSAPIYGLNTGTGDVAGSFRINNAANNFPALFAESNGTGRTATFRKLGTTGTQPAVFIQSMGGSGLWADHNSTNGFAAIIQTINTGNPNAGLYAESIGTGPSMWALKSTDAVGGNAFTAENQIATGGAADFHISNASNPNAALFANTDGTGAAIQGQTSTGFTAIYGRREGATNGNAGLFEIIDAGNTYPSLQSNTIGTGSAANFQINNVSSSAPAAFVQTNGTGSAISATHTGSSGDAINAVRQGTGAGSAGNFRISNSGNNASAVFGVTNQAGGTGIGASNESNGVALAIWSGGMKVTTETVTSTTIANRAMAYHITSGGTSYSFSFGPTQGDVFYVFNDTGAGITVEGVAIGNGTGRLLIHFGGAGFKGF